MVSVLRSPPTMTGIGRLRREHGLTPALMVVVTVTHGTARVIYIRVSACSLLSPRTTRQDERNEELFSKRSNWP